MFKRSRNISYYEHFQIFLSNKTNLFCFLSIAFVSIIVYPIIIPHLSHPSMIYHIAIHIISFDMALFLTCISILSYNRTKSKRILLTSSSFGVLVIIELVYLLQSSNILGQFPIPYIGGEISHVLLLFMMALFAMGIIKVEKRQNIMK
jgi:hypothetical protein